MTTQLVNFMHINVSATIGGLHQDHLMKAANGGGNIDVSKVYELCNQIYCLKNILPT